MTWEEQKKQYRKNCPLVVATAANPGDYSFLLLSNRPEGEDDEPYIEQELTPEDALVLIADLTSALQRTIDKMCDESDTIERAYRSLS